MKLLRELFRRRLDRKEEKKSAPPRATPKREKFEFLDDLGGAYTYKSSSYQSGKSMKELFGRDGAPVG